MDGGGGEGGKEAPYFAADGSPFRKGVLIPFSNQNYAKFAQQYRYIDGFKGILLRGTV